MRGTTWLGLALAATLVGGAAGAQHTQHAAASPSQAHAFVVLPHLGGKLALPVSRIASAWLLPATADKPAQVRVTSPVLGEAKTVGGADAEALWRTLHDGPLAATFVFTSHMQGTLAIPRAQIHTAFLTEQDGKRQLRLVWEGDPSGKTIEGDEALRLWQVLTG